MKKRNFKLNEKGYYIIDKNVKLSLDDFKELFTEDKIFICWADEFEARFDDRSFEGGVSYLFINDGGKHFDMVVNLRRFLLMQKRTDIESEEENRLKEEKKEEKRIFNLQKRKATSLARSLERAKNIGYTQFNFNAMCKNHNIDPSLFERTGKREGKKRVFLFNLKKQ